MPKLNVVKGEDKYLPDEICPECGHKGLWEYIGFYSGAIACPVWKCKYIDGYSAGR